MEFENGKEKLKSEPLSELGKMHLANAGTQGFE